MAGLALHAALSGGIPSVSRNAPHAVSCRATGPPPRFPFARVSRSGKEFPKVRGGAPQTETYLRAIAPLLPEKRLERRCVALERRQRGVGWARLRLSGN